MSDPVGIARTTFTATLERVLAAGDDPEAMLETWAAGEEELRGDHGLAGNDRDQAVAEYRKLVAFTFDVEVLAVLALVEVIHDDSVAADNVLQLTTALVWAQAADDDQALAATFHLVYLDVAGERRAAVLYAWQVVRCAWFGVEAADDVGIDERETLILTDPRWAATIVEPPCERPMSALPRGPRPRSRRRARGRIPR